MKDTAEPEKIVGENDPNHACGCRRRAAAIILNDDEVAPRNC